MKTLLNILPLAISLLFQQSVIAQHEKTSDAIHLTKSSEPIKIDGILDEKIWRQLDPLPMSMYTPVNGAQPSERTEIMITYDDTYMYLAARMYVSDPSVMRINTFTRDVPSNGSEFIFFFTSDYQNLEGFSINPVGKRVDAQMLCNTDCNDWFNPDWNIIWKGNSVITHEGWFTEARVPISSLNFNVEGDKLTFGFIGHRLIGAKNERVTFPHISPEWPTGYFRAALAQKMSIDNIKQKKPLYVTPYVLGKMEQQDHEKEQYSGEFGVDVRFKLSANSTVDLTYNTDFAQVESDDQQINLTQFSLFYPEKRQFFQERSGVFTFSTGRNEKLFYSRRIGLSSNGQPVKIIGGMRAVSKIGKWDVGVLDMQTDRFDQDPAENFGIFRVKKNILNPASYIGSMITSRVDEKGQYNLNLGLDASFNLFESDFATIRAVSTLKDESTLDINSSLLMLEWKRPSDIGLGYELAVEHRGRDYNPAVGFVTRKDHLAYFSGVRYGWFAPDNSKVRNFGPSVENYVIRNYTLDAVEFNSLNVSWQVNMKTNSSFTASLLSEYQNIVGGFNLSETVEVPSNIYRTNRVMLDYASSSQNLARIGVNFITGGLFDGKGYSLTVSPAWTQSKRLELGSTFQLNHYKFADRDQELKVLLAQFRVRFALNTKLSINLLGQYNTTTEQVGINTRLRYNFEDGHDLYIVYNQTQNYNTNINPRETQLSEQQGIFIKYLYTFSK